MKKKAVKKPVKKVVVLKKKSTPKKASANETLLAVSLGFEKTLTKEEFSQETEKIFTVLRELKSEMTERFEKHENIILAEYRHRIEALEEKVRKLMEK